MRFSALRRAAARELGFSELNAVWRQCLQDGHLRTIGRWHALPDEGVAQHLAGVSELRPWWSAVTLSCPLVASPTAERTICEVRFHLARLLAQSPASLPASSSSSLLGLAEALSAQARQSEHAYLLYPEERQWAQELQLCVGEWAPVAEALVPALSPPDGVLGMAGEASAVRHFYERDPIPRWTELTPWEPVEALAKPLRAAGTPRQKVLAAGCGTGRWACHFAATFPETDVVAVDISQASLAYACGKKLEFDLENIRFEHGDLAAWDSEQRSFDFIECGGVLHHLPDPENSWAQLASSLKPGGVMLVSLYSRLARQTLKDLRRELLPRASSGQLGGEEWSPAQSVDDEILRRFRHLLLAKAWTSEELGQLARSADLHSLSRLRDAFFHPLEHEYSLLEVKAMLDRLGLRFIGIDDREMLDLFQGAMPGRDPLDLFAWHELELKIPDLFIGMYQFFVTR